MPRVFLTGVARAIAVTTCVTVGPATAAPGPRGEIDELLSHEMFIADCIGKGGGPVLVGLEPTYAEEGAVIAKSWSSRLVASGAAESVSYYAPENWDAALSCESPLPSGPRAVVFLQFFKDSSGEIQAALVRVRRQNSCREVALERGKYPSRCRAISETRRSVPPLGRPIDGENSTSPSRDDADQEDGVDASHERRRTSTLPRSVLTGVGVGASFIVMSTLGLALSSASGKRAHARIEQPPWATAADNGRSVCDLEPAPDGCAELERAKRWVVASAIGLGISLAATTLFTGLLLHRRRIANAPTVSLHFMPTRATVVVGVNVGF